MVDAVCGSRLDKEPVLKIDQNSIAFQTHFFPGRDSKEHKFSGHLQLAFEHMPIQELILLVLAEEVSRLVGRAQQGNHRPIVTLNKI